VGGVALLSLLRRLGLAPFGTAAQQAGGVTHPAAVSGERARRERGNAPAIPLRDMIRSVRRA
jgi:hypothetical protein